MVALAITKNGARAFALALSMTCGIFAAQAQTPSDMHELHVKRAILMALKQIHYVECEPGVKCTPVTDAEYDNLPIPVPEARRIIAAGITSGTAQWCGVDWQQKVLLPMLTYYDKQLGWTPRQRTLAALMLGIYQAQTYGPLRPRGECPSEVRDNVAQSLPVWGG